MKHYESYTVQRWMVTKLGLKIVKFCEYSALVRGRQNGGEVYE